jgi:hypothetical protein
MMIDRDVALFHRALTEGWDIEPERRKRYFAALDHAVRNSDEIEDADARGRLIAIAVKCVIADRALQVRMYEAMLRRLGMQQLSDQVKETFGQLRKNAQEKEESFDFTGFAALQRNADKLGGGK